MNRVRIESAPHGSGRTLRLTAAQHDLLRRSAHAFFALVPEGPGRELALGPGGANLPTLLASAGPADGEGFVRIAVTPGQLHAVHAMLTTLVVLVPSELAFMRQVGFFRENAAGFAAGLRRAAGSGPGETGVT